MTLPRETVDYYISCRYDSFDEYHRISNRLRSALGDFTVTDEGWRILLWFKRPITPEEIALDNGLLFLDGSDEELDPYITTYKANNKWMESNGLGHLYLKGI